MATTHVNARVQKHRDALRMAGLRPVQLWVPDTRRPDFAKECRRQSRLAAKADAAITRLMDESMADVDGWTA
jgi:hypothetical protein